MAISKSDLIDLATNSCQESDLLDFKREFTPEKKAAFWAETVKDIVAFANTRGGIIVFGLLDDGTSAEIDCSDLFDLDDAQLTDQVRKYTGANLPGMSIVEVKRGETVFPAILISPAASPLVFTKVGTYEVETGKQKTAFSVGTIYFRHSSKSEPCTQADIEGVIQKRLEETRNDWLGNIRKVVEAEPGASVVVTHPSETLNNVQITNDPSAPMVRLPKLSDGYPFKQSEVINKLNERLRVSPKINTHDIQAIKLYEGIDENSRPELLSKPHENSSPQYSQSFIDLIASKRKKDEDYFVTCRQNWKETMY